MADPVIKVTSKSFSAHPVLRAELLEKFPNTEFNENGVIYTEDTVADYFQGADGAVVGLEPITASVLDRCSGLQIVAKYGVGLDNVDQQACADRQVKIGWTGGVNRRGVAEMAICYMTGLARHVFLSAWNLRDGDDWNKIGGFDLSGKTVGIIGVGFIGKEVISLLKPFGCEILVNDVIDQSAYYAEAGVTEVSKKELFTQSDIVTVHTPLDDTTRHLINAETLAMMKPTAYLLNVARGPIVEQVALKSALQDNIIAGAALDVFEEEPCDDKEFLALPNLICTPHTGGSSAESILAMGRSAIGHLDNYFNG